MQSFNKLPISQRGKLAVAAAHYWSDIACTLDIEPDDIRSGLHSGASPNDCSRALFTKIADAGKTVNEVVLAFKKLRLTGLLSNINLTNFESESGLGSKSESKFDKDSKVTGFQYFESLASTKVGKDLAYITSILNVNRYEIRKYPLLRNIEQVLGFQSQACPNWAELLEKFPFVAKAIHASFLMANISSNELNFAANLDHLVEEALVDIFEGCKIENLVGLNQSNLLALISGKEILADVVAIIPSDYSHVSTLTSNPSLILTWANGRGNGHNRRNLIRVLKKLVNNSILLQQHVTNIYPCDTEEIMKEYRKMLAEKQNDQVAVCQKSWSQKVLIDKNLKLSSESEKKLIQFLEEEGIDDETLKLVNNDILEKYGFKFGDRCKILKAFE